MNWTGRQVGEGYEYHLLAIALIVTILVRGAGALSLTGRFRPQELRTRQRFEDPLYVRRACPVNEGSAVDGTFRDGPVAGMASPASLISGITVSGVGGFVSR